MKTTESPTPRRITYIAVIAVPLAISFLIFCHAGFMNGPSYWKWPWRRLPGLSLFLSMAAGFIPFLLAHWIHHLKKNAFVWCLSLIMLSMFCMQLIAIANQSDGFNLRRIPSIVECPYCTSYFTEALSVKSIKPFLQSFHASHRVGHSDNKPPGPVLYYVALLRLFSDPYYAAFTGGILIGLLATFSIPATYLLTKALGCSRDAAFHAASYMAVTPGLLLFFPEFDQIYPLFTCMIIGCWALAVGKDSLLYSSLLGIAVCAVFFITWSPAVLIVFLALHAVFVVCRSGSAKRFVIVIKHAFAALSIVAVIYLILWIVSGYDPVKTLIVSMERQSQIAPPDRKYPYTILFDLTDFCLGLGWPILIVILLIINKIRSRYFDNEWWICIIGLAQVVFVAVMHLLPAETARVWIFLFPCIAIPAGMQLSRFPFLWRIAVYASTCFLAAVICQNMIFIQPSRFL